MAVAQEVIVVKSPRTGVLAGVISGILAILGFFTYGLVFVPPAIFVALIGTIVALKNFNLGGIAVNLLAWVFIFFAFAVSPSLWIALGLSIGSPQ